MDIWTFFGQVGLGLPLGLAAIGSALGIYTAGQSAVGAWGKDAKAGRPLNFAYIILAGMPLSQTIYAFIFSLVGISGAIIGDGSLTSVHGGTLFGLGLACGIAELFSAWLQGKIGAAGCRVLSESDGKGLVQVIITMGIVETVGLFGFVFLLLMVPK